MKKNLYIKLKKHQLVVSFLIFSIFINISLFCKNSKSKKINFPCTQGRKITLAFTGDILLQEPLQTQAFTTKKGHYGIFEEVVPILKQADILFGNLEGVSAKGINVENKYVGDVGMVYDDYLYSGYPKFNYHNSLIKTLAKIKFNILSLANNHSLDRSYLGVNKTIQVIKKYKMHSVGARKSYRKRSKLYTIIRQKGFRLAYIACTYGINKIKDSRRNKRKTKNQIFQCYKHEKKLLKTIKRLNRSRYIDAVIVTPHWGIQYTYEVQDKEKELAQKMLDAGALLVIGSHPHVLQKWQLFSSNQFKKKKKKKFYRIKDSKRFVVYSLGNFISHHTDPAIDRRTSVILFVGLTKKRRKIYINGIQYIPTFMIREELKNRIVPIDSITNKIKNKFKNKIKNKKQVYYSDKILEEKEEAQKIINQFYTNMQKANYLHKIKINNKCIKK